MVKSGSHLAADVLANHVKTIHDVIVGGKRIRIGLREDGTAYAYYDAVGRQKARLKEDCTLGYLLNYLDARFMPTSRATRMAAVA